MTVLTDLVAVYFVPLITTISFQKLGFVTLILLTYYHLAYTPFTYQKLRLNALLLLGLAYLFVV